MDLITYAILNHKIKTAATGIEDIYKDGDYIVFVMGDGSKFRIEDTTKDIIDIDFDEENYIIITYVDGTTTKSDNPIPLPNVMEGATDSKAGKEGLVPAPSTGSLRYLNSRGQWDGSITASFQAVNDRLNDTDDRIDLLSSVVPVTGIPEGATLTADGWTITNDQEVADEFALWEG